MGCPCKRDTYSKAEQNPPSWQAGSSSTPAVQSSLKGTRVGAAWRPVPAEAGSGGRLIRTSKAALRAPEQRPPPAPAAGPTARPGRAGDFPEAAGRSQGLSSLHACQAAAGACGLAALPGPEPEAHEAATRAYQPGGGRHPEDAELGGHPTGPQGSSTPSQARRQSPPFWHPPTPRASPSRESACPEVCSPGSPEQQQQQKQRHLLG